MNRAPASRTAVAGFTIVELMVALTIGLFMVGALIAIVMGSAATSASRERTSALQSNGRYAVEQIRRDLMHSGYLGISSLFVPDLAITTAQAGPPPIAAINVANVCDSTRVGRLSQRIWGAENSNPYFASCIPPANYLRGDVLVIRGLQPTAATPPYSANLAYYRSSYEGGAPFVGPTAPDLTTTNKNPPYIDFRIDETVYYISPYTNSPTESPLVPALYRLKLASGPAMVPELVASGVEQMKVRYGVFQTNDTVRYLAANELTTADWDLVRAVQINLLMRTTDAEPGYSNQETYMMGGDSYTVNDRYPRLLLSTVIQLRN